MKQGIKLNPYWKAKPRYTINRVLDDLDKVGNQLGNCYDVFHYEYDHDGFKDLYSKLSKERKNEYHVELKRLLDLVKTAQELSLESKTRL